MSYAIISLGGKQYRVSEGQRLLVDRLERIRSWFDYWLNQQAGSSTRPGGTDARPSFNPARPW